jgi:O-antigen/teichoic acid export membrane protein
MADTDDFARQQIRSGIAHLGGGAAVVRIIDLLASLVVLRLLTEKDMGLAALAASVTIILESLCGFGLRTSIVAAASIGPADRDQLIGFTAITGLAFGLVAVASAWPLASAYQEPALAAMVAVSAVKLLLVSLTVVPQTLLARELAFRAVAGLQTLGAVAGAITKVGLAYWGLGAWALVWANVLSAAAVLAGTWIITWTGPPQFWFRYADVAWHVKFGARAALSGLLTETSKNIDYFMVGLFLGVGPLGIYRVAFEMATTPLESIAQPIYRATFSVFSRISSNRERLRQAFVEATRSMLALTGPVAVVLYLATGDLFAVVTKGGWEASVPAIRILCWAAFLRTVTRLFDNLFYARREPGMALLDGIATFVLLALGVPLGLLAFGGRYGILVPCYVWLGTYPVVYGLLFAVAVRRGALVPSSYFRGILPALLATMVTLAVAVPLERLVSGLDAPLARLAIVSGGVSLTYFLVARYGVHLPLSLRGRPLDE